MIGRLDELEADLIARRGGPTVRAGSARSKVSTSPSAIFAASENRRAEWPGPPAGPSSTRRTTRGDLMSHARDDVNRPPDPPMTAG